MKGQFFIISTVIMISALMLINHYLYDYKKIDLTTLQEMHELNYIQMVKDSLKTTANISMYNGGCEKLESDLKETELFLKDNLIKKGIILTLNYDTSECPESVSFKFDLSTSNFLSTTEFSFP